MDKMGSDIEVWVNLIILIGGLDAVDSGVPQLSSSGPMSQPTCGS